MHWLNKTINIFVVLDKYGWKFVHGRRVGGARVHENWMYKKYCLYNVMYESQIYIINDSVSIWSEIVLTTRPRPICYDLL